ncbi:MAG TPA: hypothetical protein VK548_18735 [Candidatus Acidoferrum sp.]|nr:hypothetical protein [Candidatus Acidoferrum sp.]
MNPTKATRSQPRPLTGDEGAKRSAALILEVLAGLRTPTEASEALGVTAMRYYVLERRALEGMVQALQPRPKGKRRRPEDALQEAGREKVRLEREMGRLQALVRAAQRTMGLPPAPSREKRKGDKRRRRRPQVRAVKAMALLRTPAPEAGPTAKAPEANQ